VLDQVEEVFTLGADNTDAVERLWLDLADLIENRIPPPLARRIDAGAATEHLHLRGQRYFDCADRSARERTPRRSPHRAGNLREN
jgi:hypothetical protein